MNWLTEFYELFTSLKACSLYKSEGTKYTTSFMEGDVFKSWLIKKITL